MKIEWNNITPEQYNALRLSVGWDPVTKAQAEIGLKNSCVLTAVEDGKILGMVRTLSDGAIQCFIAELIVAPEYQHRGIASLLMKKMLLHEKYEGEFSEGVKYVNVLVRNGRETFYEKFGFVKRPNIFQGAGMTMKLDPRRKNRFEYYQGK